MKVKEIKSQLFVEAKVYWCNAYVHTPTQNKLFDQVFVHTWDKLVCIMQPGTAGSVDNSFVLYQNLILLVTTCKVKNKKFLIIIFIT